MRVTTPGLAARFGWSDQYRALQAGSDRRRAPQGLLTRAIRGYLENVVSLQTLATLRGMDAVKVGGHVLVASGADQTLHLWQYDSLGAARRVCCSTATPITPTGWAQYVQALRTARLQGLSLAKPKHDRPGLPAVVADSRGT
jgi:hypothetical protein